MQNQWSTLLKWTNLILAMLFNSLNHLRNVQFSGKLHEFSSSPIPANVKFGMKMYFFTGPMKI